MALLFVACLGLLSGVAMGGTQPSISACPDATTLLIVGCLTPLGQTRVGQIAQAMASANVTAMFSIICDANLTMATTTGILSCLNPKLANCNQSDTVVQMLSSASAYDIADLCMYKGQCPMIIESLRNVGPCLVTLQAGPQGAPACTRADNSCDCINMERTKCAAAANAGVFQRKLQLAYSYASQNDCLDANLPKCVNNLLMSTTQGASAATPALLLLTAAAVLRFL